MVLQGLRHEAEVPLFALAYLHARVPTSFYFLHGTDVVPAADAYSAVMVPAWRSISSAPWTVRCWWGRRNEAVTFRTQTVNK